jgi:DNA-dependent RNA polymerase auxiliary subunit epsilon
MKNFLLISILFAVFGCRTTQHHNLQKTDEQKTKIADLYSCYKNDFSKVLYKSEITVFKNRLSGLTLIKRMPDSSYRINFITELGLKIFDFEIKGEDFKVIYCIEKMNKKKLIRVLKDDLTLLLLENKLNEKAVIFKNKDNNEKVYRFHQKNSFKYYYVDPEAGKLNKIEECGCFSTKVSINFSDFRNNIPDKIVISHHHIKFNIILNRIDK